MKNSIKKELISVDKMNEIAIKLIKKMPEVKIFTFTGPLGAGKTTLVQHVLRMCGVVEPITSPTYTYVNLYRLKDGTILYHFDLYRIETLTDFLAAGFDEYLYQENSYCFIEWPEAIKDLIKTAVCHSELEYADDGNRWIVIQ